MRQVFAAESIWRSPSEVEHAPPWGEIDREPDSFPCNPILATCLTLTIHLRRGLRLWRKDAPAAFLESGPASSGRGGEALAELRNSRQQPCRAALAPERPALGNTRQKAEAVNQGQKNTPSGSKSLVPAAPCYWAPKIPSVANLAGPAPRKYEPVHNHGSETARGFCLAPTLDHQNANAADHMTDDEHQPRTASEIPEWELEEMIRDVVRQTMRPDIAERALAWLDRMDDLLAVLRKEMPDVNASS